MADGGAERIKIDPELVEEVYQDLIGMALHKPPKMNPDKVRKAIKEVAASNASEEAKKSALGRLYFWLERSGL